MFGGRSLSTLNWRAWFWLPVRCAQCEWTQTLCYLTVVANYLCSARWIYETQHNFDVQQTTCSLQVTLIFEPKENISSAFLKHGEKKLNIYCTTFDYNVWTRYHSILEYQRSLCMFLFILFLFLSSLLFPFLSMCIQFYFVCLEIKLLWLYVIRTNKMHVIYYKLLYILLLMFITKTKSLLTLIK